MRRRGRAASPAPATAAAPAASCRRRRAAWSARRTLRSAHGASGENRNWPNEPAAVPAPNAKQRQLSGTSLPSAPITIGNEQPARPKPISTPAERSSISVDRAVRHPGKPDARRGSRRRDSTRIGPKRSAIAPANGCAAPQSRFCMAIANENASRPQPRSNDIGDRNWPSAERGPKAINAIAQPTAISTIGVRQADRLQWRRRDRR